MFVFRFCLCNFRCRYLDRFALADMLYDSFIYVDVHVCFGFGRVRQPDLWGALSWRLQEWVQWGPRRPRSLPGGSCRTLLLSRSCQLFAQVDQARVWRVGTCEIMSPWMTPLHTLKLPECRYVPAISVANPTNTCRRFTNRTKDREALYRCPCRCQCPIHEFMWDGIKRPSIINVSDYTWFVSIYHLII